MIKNIIRSIFIALGIFIAILVVRAEEGIHMFSIWNLIPIGLGYVVIELALSKAYKNKPKILYSAIGFVLFLFGVVALSHFAWLYDWGGMATGSSTAALIFIFIPIYSIPIGLIGAGLGWLVAEVCGFKNS